MTGHTSYTPPAAARVTLSGRRQTPCRNQQPEPPWRLAWAVCVGMRMHGPEGGGAQQCAPPTRQRRGRVSNRVINEAFVAARDAAALPAELDLHCLRHSYVTHLVEFDYPERFV